LFNLLKLTDLSWWIYHWQHRNVLKTWYRYLKSRQFPSNVTGTNNLVSFGNRHFILGFNNECIRSYIIWSIHKCLMCTSFVETGTLYGATAGYVRRTFKTPVFTSEINRTYYLISKFNLIWFRGINKFLSNSPDFLRQICTAVSIGNCPMFYLDAHWYDYVPLPEELAIIAENCEKCVIVIDDFFVPSEPEFRYDDYESLRIDLDVVYSSLLSCRSDVFVYLPAYSPNLDPGGKGIGYCVVILGGVELPEDKFPFNMLLREYTGERFQTELLSD